MASRVSSPVFVGRRHELKLAKAALARAHEGEPQVLLVGGEAGVGKTRFVREVAHALRGSGGRVLEGGCVQVGTDGLPFEAIVEALRHLPEQLTTEQLAQVVGLGRRVLALFIAEIDTKDGDPDVAAVIEPRAQGPLFEHLLQLFERLGSIAPLLVVIEDVHWADRSTLELLGFLARNLRRGRVTLLITYRSDELHRRHPLLPFLAEQERAGRAERIALERLNRAEVAAQVEAIQGEAPSPALVDGLMSRAQGNAFYVEELLASSTGELPGTLREVLLARLATLTPATQDVLSVAAAGGTRISPRLIAAVSGLTPDEIDAAMREAVAGQILVPAASESDDRFEFRHALVQEAIAGELLPGERVRLHAAYAEALTTVGEASATHAAEIAYHWQAAHDLPRAFDGWIRAGIAAEAIAAFAEAQADYDHALELWDRVPDADGRAPIDRVDLLDRAAEMATIHGWLSGRSLGYVRAALALVDPAREPVRAGLLHERLAFYIEREDRFEDVLTYTAHQTAMELVPKDPPSAARAIVLSGFARWLALMERFGEARAAGEEAVAVATAAGIEGPPALAPLGLAQAVLGDPDLGLATIERAWQLALRRGDVVEAARTFNWRIEALYELGRDEESAAAGLAGEAYGIEHGQRSGHGGVCAAMGAEALMSLGRWAEASDVLDRAAAYGLQATEAILGSRLGHLEALRGEPISLGPLAVGERAWIAAFNPFRGPAERALWAHTPEVARDVLRAPLERVGDRTEVSPRYFGWACWLALRAEADVAIAARAQRRADALAEAETAGNSILERFRRFGEAVAASRPVFLPITTRWLALCRAEADRLAGASNPTAWQTAADLHRSEPYLCAYALMREGEARMSDRRDRARGAALLGEAGAMADRLGARPLRRTIDALLALTEPKPSPLPGRYALSPREREVLALVVGGRSDAEIGQALFISPKTASVHVSNIKSKLGAASRVEIVTTAIALGLTEFSPASG